MNEQRKEVEERTCSTCKDKDCAGSKFINQNCWKPEKEEKEQIDHELYENACWVRSCISNSHGIDEFDLIKIAKGIIESRKQARLEGARELADEMLKGIANDTLLFHSVMDYLSEMENEGVK